MMPDKPTQVARDAAFLELMAMVRAGDEDAARQVHDRSSGQLIRRVRARLGRTAAGKEDAEDVIQSVYRTFFRRYSEGSFQLEDWSEVWALLVTIAKRKCSNRRKRYQADRRDTRRELSMSSREVVSSEPTAEDAAMLSDTVDRLLDGLKETEQGIVLLSLQGYSAHDIAEVIGRSERTVQRVRERVRSQLHRWNESEAVRVSA